MNHTSPFCVICLSENVREVITKPDQIVFEGNTYTAERRVMLCGNCEFSWIEPQQLTHNFDAYWAVANSIAGYFDRSNVLTLREAYEVTVAEAAGAFDITADLYCKYENGEHEVPRELGAKMKRALDEPEYFVNLLISSKKRNL